MSYFEKEIPLHKSSYFRTTIMCDKCGAHHYASQQIKTVRQEGSGLDAKHYCSDLTFDCERRAAAREGREPDFTGLYAPGCDPNEKKEGVR